MVADLRAIIENSEAAGLEVSWSPSAGLYTARVWHETDANMPGTAHSTWLHASPDWLKKVRVCVCVCVTVCALCIHMRVCAHEGGYMLIHAAPEWLKDIYRGRGGG